LTLAGGARAADLLGQPTPGAIGMQPGASPLRHSAIWFNNWVLTPIIVSICLFVLALLVYVVVKFNAKSNPTPARFTHNTAIEVVWTLAPVLILMFIAIFSFRLLYTYHDMPKPDVTVKVVGNQWYWTYEYPGAGDFSYDSIPLKEKEAEAKGPGLYRLAVDNPMVVPVGATVQVLATGADVLHSFFVPAFGIQETTIPGRINQTWFKPEKEGIYYGECNELCGVNHCFMPIEIDVVSPAKYQAWLAGHAKKTPAALAANTGASPTPTPAAGQGAAASAPASSGPAGATVGPVTAATGAASAPVAAAPAPASQAGPVGKAKAAPTAKPATANPASPAE
jgi:cytochrome c oxidase subunit 2